LIYKDNPNPPSITFRRFHGRIVPIVQGHAKVNAGKLIEQHLTDVGHEVKAAVKGSRGVGHDDGSGFTKNFAEKSTFPKFYSDVGFKNKENFFKVLGSKSGVKYNQMVHQAHEDLSHGSETTFGRLPPNMSYRVATKQTFDNTRVVFRNQGGKVHPMRLSKSSFVPF